MRDVCVRVRGCGRVVGGTGRVRRRQRLVFAVFGRHRVLSATCLLYEVINEGAPGGVIENY